VSQLGDLLELLHGAEEPFETVAVTWRVWRHHERAQRAFLAEAERSGGRVAIAYGPGDSPEESTETVRVWRAGDRVREEHGDGSYGVTVGSTWWRWHELAGAISNEDEPEVAGGVGERLSVFLSPARLLGSVRLRVIGEGEVAGRPAIEAEAMPRALRRGEPHGFELHELGHGAERYVLQVDRERGVLLASTAYFESEPFISIEATEIAFDQPIDPERFVFVPPPGETVHSSRDQGVHHHHVTLVEAQQRASFTVLMPRQVPADWRPRCMYVEARERPQVPETVALFYHSDDGHQSVNINQSAAAEKHAQFSHMIGAGDWEPRRDGVHVRGLGGQSQAHVERAGTFAFLSSDTLSCDELARLADALVPAPDQAPI
jgi:hypothetical protein